MAKVEVVKKHNIMTPFSAPPKTRVRKSIRLGEGHLTQEQKPKRGRPAGTKRKVIKKLT